MCRLYEWAIKNKERKKNQIWGTILFSLTSNRQITSGHRRSKDVPGSTCVLPSITVIQIPNDQLSFFNQILCTWQELSALEAPFDERERIAPNRAIKRRISSLVSGLFYRGKHHLWCRYLFSRPSRRSRHALWPRFSLISLFSPPSNRTSHSCFSRFSRWSQGTLRTFLSLWSPPATWTFCPSGTRKSGGTCGTYLLTWLTVLEGHKLLKLFCDFFSHVMYCDASWSFI